MKINVLSIQNMQFCKDSKQVQIWPSVIYSMETKLISMQTQAELAECNTQNKFNQVPSEPGFLQTCVPWLTAFGASSDWGLSYGWVI